jgi:hypothetical protein
MACFKFIVFELKHWGRLLSQLFQHFHDILLARLGGLELHQSIPIFAAIMSMSVTPHHLLYHDAQKRRNAKQIFHPVLRVCIRNCWMVPTFTYVKEAKQAEREGVSSCHISTEGLLQSRLTEPLQPPLCLIIIYSSHKQNVLVNQAFVKK